MAEFPLFYYAYTDSALCKRKCMDVRQPYISRVSAIGIFMQPVSYSIINNSVLKDRIVDVEVL